jgi:hypothetical protein
MTIISSVTSKSHHSLITLRRNAGVIVMWPMPLICTYVVPQSSSYCIQYQKKCADQSSTKYHTHYNLG